MSEYEHALCDVTYSDELDAYIDLDGHDGEHMYRPVPNGPGYYVDSVGAIIGPGGHSKPSAALKTWTNQYGHQYVGVHHRKMLVHRVVAEAFIPNPDDLPIVRHINDCPENNAVENLAWGSQTDNMQDCISHGRFRYLTPDDISKAVAKRSAPVIACRIGGNEETCYRNQAEAARQLGVHQACISDIVRGKRKSSKGWVFRNAE